MELVKIEVKIPTITCPSCDDTFSVMWVESPEKYGPKNGLHIIPAFCPLCGWKLQQIVIEMDHD
jgi:C4-type Zn-finger protein